MQREMKLPKIGDMLVSQGHISQRQLDEALNIQRDGEEKIGRILVHLGYADQATIDRCLIEQIITPSLRAGISELTDGAFESLPTELAYQRLSRTRLVTENLLSANETDEELVSIKGTAVLRVGDEESISFDFSISPDTGVARLDKTYAGGLRIWVNRLARSRDAGTT